MRSAKIIASRRFEVFDEDIPTLEDGKILVRLLRTAICGSDLPYFSGSYDPKSYPFPSGYPGHECMGVVEESLSPEFRSGERVMYYPSNLDGFMEYHLTDPSRLQKLPDEGNPDILLMTQLLGAVAHCAFRLDKPHKKSVLILGQGPVGLLFTALMKNLGAKTIIAVDPYDYRLATATKMGADIVINPQKSDVVGAVSEITKGDMADIVIDAYGQEVDVINQCFDLVCHNGQVAFFGICLEESPGLNFNVFFRKELRMIASVGPDITLDYPYALKMILQNSIDVTPLITHVMPFEEIQKGFEKAVKRDDETIKIVLKF
ncbi:MAG: zinc-binding dehydrogenase [Spirochaetota bacterium]|nr:zinc-binding dehydrogenase [Spirochaetota bacterium]